MNFCFYLIPYKNKNCYFKIVKKHSNFVFDLETVLFLTYEKSSLCWDVLG